MEVVAAAPMAANGRSAAALANKPAALVADPRQALTQGVAVRTEGTELAAISARKEIIRRTFVPQSMMASGIRSAIPMVPRG